MSDIEYLNVGDILVIKTWMNHVNYEITRVTKTLAMSARKGDGYEHKFKRKIQSDMAHPSMQWNTANYSVIKKLV